MITRDNEDTREFLKVEEGDNNKMTAKEDHIDEHGQSFKCFG